MVSDNAGGAIIGWNPSSGGFMAQRIDLNGTKLWGNGIYLIANNRCYHMVSDGAGGAYYFWKATVGSEQKIMAQRINGNGVPLWDPNGIEIDSYSGSGSYYIWQAQQCLGGCMISWYEYHYDEYFYLQKIDSNGYFPWGEAIVIRSDSSRNVYDFHFQHDNNGGAYCFYLSCYISNDYNHCYNSTRHYNQSGNSDWNILLGYVYEGGLGFYETDFISCPDSSSSPCGVVASWILQDDYTTTPLFRHGTRISPSGENLWGNVGFQLDTFESLLSSDEFTIHLSSYNSGLYAQKRNSDGVKMWNPDPVPFSLPYTKPIQGSLENDKNAQDGFATVAVSDGAGGFVAVICSNRSGDYDIYAQRVLANGTLPQNAKKIEDSKKID